MNLRSCRGAFGGAALSAVLGLIVACASDDSDSRSVAGGDPGGYGPGPGSGGSSGGLDGGGYAGALGELPEEEKDLSAFRSPVVTGKYLWFANPESSRVAVIEARTREVQVLNGGFRPTHIAAVPAKEGVSSALVLNVGSNDATWFHLEGGKVTDKTFDLHEGANRWSVSASGRWAVAWSAEDPDVDLDPTQGLQDITIADLKTSPIETHRLSVGYRPSSVSFSAGEESLLVVAEPGISVIDLTGETPSTARWVNLGGGSASRRGVLVTPNGEFALVRRSGEPTVQLLPLDGSVPQELTLSGPVTDIALSADGTRAVAVVREKRQLVTFDVEEAYADPDVFDVVTVPGEVFGSAALNPDGEFVTLYTTAADSGRLVIVDLRPGATYLAFRAVDVKAPVRAVQPTPDGEHAIALMGPSGDSTHPGSFAFVSVREARFPRIEATQATVHQVAVSTTAALVTTRDTQSGVFEGYVVQMPGGSVERVRLSSPPTAVGILETENLGYVAQSHPEGRVSIFDFAKGHVRTLTGFELASKVVD